MSKFRRRLMLAQGGGKRYIQFADPAVEAICVANWSSDGIGLTYEDAAAVTSLANKFKDNTSIVSFDELQYFGVSSLGYQFQNCSNLQSVIVGQNNADTHAYAFQKCTSLHYVEFKGTIAKLGDQAFGGIKTYTVVVFRSTTPPQIITNTAFWSSTGFTLYCPYSADHSVLSAYQTAFSVVANYAAAIVGIYELNPDGTIPS